MKQLKVFFKNGNLKKQATRVQECEFILDTMNYNYFIRIASDWGKQANVKRHVETHENEVNRSIGYLYLIARYEGLEYELKGDILKMRCLHLSGEFEYVSYYKLYN